MHDDAIFQFWHSGLPFKATVINNLLRKSQEGGQLSHREFAVVMSGPGMAVHLSKAFPDAQPEFPNHAIFTCDGDQFTVHWQPGLLGDWDNTVTVSTIRSFQVPDSIYPQLEKYKHDCGIFCVTVIDRFDERTILNFTTTFCMSRETLKLFVDCVKNDVERLNTTIAKFGRWFAGDIEEAGLREKGF